MQSVVVAKLREVGFTQIEAWPSCYFHSKLRLFLSVYVDDFKMSGPVPNLDKGWELIRRGIKLEPPVTASLYLGCMHEFSEKQSVRAVTYNMEDYLRSTVEAYQKLCINITGKESKLRPVATPFLPEDDDYAPAKSPCKEGPCIKCSYCGFLFP